MYEHAPHTITINCDLRVFRQKDTGEYIQSTDAPKLLVLSLPCRNFSEAKEVKTKLEEVLVKCIQEIKTQVWPKK